MTTVVWPHRANRVAAMIERREVLMEVPHENVRIEQRIDTPVVGAATYAKTIRVIMAGGGTGGHLYPGLAVAGALQEVCAQENLGLELVWAATPRPVDQRLLSKFGDNYVRQGVKPLVKSIAKLWAFWKGWKETVAMWQGRFEREPVDCVVALGGYAAGPAAYVASDKGVPVVLLNPDALPGLANRFLLKRSDIVVTQWPLSADYAKSVKGEVRSLGCPIRKELTGRSRDEGAARLGMEASKQTLVVTGASLGAKTINDAMLELLGEPDVRAAFELEGRWQILHLTGMDQAEQVRKAYEAYPDVQVKVVDYCDDMASVWAIADMAIARAGASTCAELTACGVPSILLPYPFHKDMHQKANAMELVRAGAAIIVDDTKDAKRNAAAIKTALDAVLYDDQRRDEMTDAARIAGKPDAAQQIAKEIVALIAKKSR